MKILSPMHYNMVSAAVRITGTFDPAETMCFFEEQLTFEEAEQIRSFLTWCHNNKKGFGSGNYQKVFAEYVLTQDTPVSVKSCDFEFCNDVNDSNICEDCIGGNEVPMPARKMWM